MDVCEKYLQMEQEKIVIELEPEPEPSVVKTETKSDPPVVKTEIKSEPSVVKTETKSEPSVVKTDQTYVPAPPIMKIDTFVTLVHQDDKKSTETPPVKKELEKPEETVDQAKFWEMKDAAAVVRIASSINKEKEEFVHMQKEFEDEEARRWKAEKERGTKVDIVLDSDKKSAELRGVDIDGVPYEMPTDFEEMAKSHYLGGFEKHSAPTLVATTYATRSLREEETYASRSSREEEKYVTKISMLTYQVDAQAIQMSGLMDQIDMQAKHIDSQKKQIDEQAMQIEKISKVCYDLKMRLSETKNKDNAIIMALVDHIEVLSAQLGKKKN